MQSSKIVTKSLSSQWCLCCLAGVKNKWQLKRLLSFETHFLSCACVCVCVFTWRLGEKKREEKCYWSYHGDSISATPLPSASLTLISSLEQKKQTFLRGIPSVAGAAAGFTNWSERGLGECVSRWGSLLRYASSRICWAQKSHKTMLISGILSVLWKIFRQEIIRMKRKTVRLKDLVWYIFKQLFRAIDERHVWNFNVKSDILCILCNQVKGNCLAYILQPSQNVTLIEPDLFDDTVQCVYLNYKQEGYLCLHLLPHLNGVHWGFIFLLPKIEKLATEGECFQFLNQMIGNRAAQFWHLTMW